MKEVNTIELTSLITIQLVGPMEDEEVDMDMDEVASGEAEVDVAGEDLEAAGEEILEVEVASRTREPLIREDNMVLNK